jgi:uncharacterized membrane protein
LPNWLYLLFHFLFTAGLAIWIGGGLALGLIVAPALFKMLPREQAGSVFGVVLRRFAQLRIAATVMIVIGAAVKYAVWESHAVSPWIAIRWVAIAFLAATVLYERFSLYPAVEARDESFQRLHIRSERLMKASLAVAMVALFFS